MPLFISLRGGERFISSCLNEFYIGQTVLLPTGGVREEPHLHFGMIGHFEAVGHVTGEADVEDGCLDSVVFHDVNNAGYEGTGLPGKSAAGFQYHLKVRPSGVEVTQGLNQEFNIVVLAGHQMAAAKVYPLELREPWRELIYNMYERARESLGAALAVAVDMETFDILGEVGGRR